MFDHINNHFTGETALIYAAVYGHTDIVKNLLENVNIDVNKQRNYGKYFFIINILHTE